MNGFDIKPNMITHCKLSAVAQNVSILSKHVHWRQNKLKDDLSLNAYTISYDLGFKTSLDNL